MGGGDSGWGSRRTRSGPGRPSDPFPEVLSVPGAHVSVTQVRLCVCTCPPARYEQAVSERVRGRPRSSRPALVAPRCVRGPRCSPDSWPCARSGWQLVPCPMLTSHAWAADPGGLVAVLCCCRIRRARRAGCPWLSDPGVPWPVC